MTIWRFSHPSPLSPPLAPCSRTADRRLFLSGLFALSAMPALTGCGTTSERFPDYRYRLTVEVDTPEGLKTGSSVIEVSTAKAGKRSIPDPGKLSRRARGEAVAVDLGNRGVLFALLRSEAEVDWAATVMFLLAPDNDQFGDAGFRKRFADMLANRNMIELPPTFPDVAHLKDRPARPMLVRFRDIADPKTVQKVDPDDLAKGFGKGAKLRRITVQMTDEPVTTGIEKRLGWLDEVHGAFERIPVSKYPPAGSPLPLYSNLTDRDLIQRGIQ